MDQPELTQSEKILSNVELNKFLADKRILITGARGFLGSHLRDALRASGCEIHGMARSDPQDGDRAGVRWWNADASDANAVDGIIGTVKPDIIFHLTSYAWGAPDLDKVLPTLQDDLVAAVNVMTSAARAKVGRLVTTGSMQEPGADGLSAPMSPYAAAKWAGAAYARMFHQVFGLPITVVRPFMVYGPAQAPGKVIPYVIRSFLQGSPPRIAQGGQLVDFVYVEDVIAGLIRAAASQGVEGKTLDLGSGRAVPLTAIVEEIAALLGSSVKAEFGTLTRPLEDLRVADTEETWRLIGWRAEVSMREGLSKTVEYWRSQI